jgi:hypothetical protein
MCFYQIDISDEALKFSEEMDLCKKGMNVNLDDEKLELLESLPKIDVVIGKVPYRSEKLTSVIAPRMPIENCRSVPMRSRTSFPKFSSPYASSKTRTYPSTPSPAIAEVSGSEALVLMDTP